LEGVMAATRRNRYDTDEISTPDPYYTHGAPTLLSEVHADPREVKPSDAEKKEWVALYDHAEQRFGALYNWRLPQWTTWGQIARYMRPDRYYAFITANTYQQGLRKDFEIIDRTATLAGEVCAAGLMAGITDPDSRWLQLGPAIPGIELDQAGKQYYEDLTERLNYIYDHSNFYDAQAQHYDDLTFFGCAPVIDYPDEKEILHCFTPCAGEYMLGAGFSFNDEVIYREFKQTISQTVEQFGPDNCPPDVLKMWREKGGALDYENVIGHSIEPNFAIDSGGAGIGVVPGGFTWRELYWIRGKKDAKPLSMTGFHEQPFAVSRWNTQGNNPYARGVGEYMLGDCIQLQFETRMKAESIQKVNTPPMGADVSLMDLPNSTNPGKITYMNTANGGEKKFFPLYEIKPDIPAISADIALVQERLRETSYNKVFAAISSLSETAKGNMTATVADAIKSEGLTQIGPVIGRIHSTLRQRVRRHLAIMGRRGLEPKKPPSLRGVPLKIDLISMLTRARLATQTADIARTVQFAGSMVAAWPESRFKVDPDAAIEEFNSGVGATSKILRPNKIVQQMVQAEAQQKKLAQVSELTQQGAASAAALSKASLAPGSALSALVQPPQ
jgi:hypothetical protein